jgi:hypothetical protein
MIKYIRSARIAPGKAPEAVAFAKEIADYVNKLLGTNFEVYVQFGGAVGTLSWIGDYDDMAGMEVATNKLNSDKGYAIKARENTDFWIVGSFHDTILMSI